MEIRPIERTNVGEQVFDQLKQLLIEGTWTPGQRLPSENELANMLHVSRVTVRQALQKLSALDLIETRLGEGSFVKKIDVGSNMNALIPVMYMGEQSLQQVFEFRQIIDVECARLAARRATLDDIDELVRIHRRYVDCYEKQDAAGFGKTDLDFHFQIAQMTRNSLIIKTNSILREVLEHTMQQVIDKMGYKNGIYYHAQLIDAIAAHDEQTAVDLMREHIKKNVGYFQDSEAASSQAT